MELLFLLLVLLISVFRLFDTGPGGQLISDNTALVQVRELERAAAASRAVYESFLKRYQEIAEQGKLSPSDATMISSAKAPKKRSSPKLSLALALGVLLAAAAGVGCALVLDRLMDALGDPDQIRAELGVPVIASIPLVPESTLRLLDPSERSVLDYVVVR